MLSLLLGIKYCVRITFAQAIKKTVTDNNLIIFPQAMNSSPKKTGAKTLLTPINPKAIADDNSVTSLADILM